MVYGLCIALLHSQNLMIFFSDETERNSQSPSLLNFLYNGRSKCYCETDVYYKKNIKLYFSKEKRRKIREELTRKKENKLNKNAKLEKHCLVEKMNCFEHNNDHWRTKPLWTSGPFCFCMNANNNTYSCIRTINNTHNFLYCEFATGFVTFYNLRIGEYT